MERMREEITVESRAERAARVIEMPGLLDCPVKMVMETVAEGRFDELEDCAGWQ